MIDASSYHFDLHNLNYTRETNTAHFAKTGEYRLLEQGYVDLPSQLEIEDVAILFAAAVTEAHTTFQTQISHKTYSFEEVAEEVYRRLQAIDEESKDESPEDRTNYTRRFTRKRCLQIVKASAVRSGIVSGRMTDENRQKVLQALGPLRRKAAKRVTYLLMPNALTIVSTRERQAVSCSAAELRRGNKTVFIPPHCGRTIPDEQLEFFREVSDPDGEFRAGSETLINTHDFKTPCNLAVADATPERRLIRLLCERKNAVALDAWVKNAAQRYYSIEYAWKKGEHPKRGEFSPDFFIKKNDMIHVLEIKDDSELTDPSLENQKKFEYAQAHFERLNQWLGQTDIATRYQHNWMSPKSYNRFFQLLREDRLQEFSSHLDVVLRLQH